MPEFDLSIYLAKFFGIYCLILALFLVMKRELLEELINEMHDMPSMWFVTGIINLMIGLAVVLSHNLWEANFTVVVTILGYLITFKGLVRMFSPVSSLEMIGSVIQGTGYWVVTVITAVIGLYLTYSGFTAMQ